MDRRNLAENTDGVPDEALLVAFANGDPDAGCALLHRLAPRILSHATRVLGNSADAEDVVQEAMIRLWKIAPDWRQGEAKVSTWLFKVVVNLCTDRLRAGSRRLQVDLASVPDPVSHEASAIDRMTHMERNNALDAALKQLPDRQRQAVVLRHMEDMSNPEIAAIMDIGVEAVESLTARGKRALTDALFERRGELGYSDD
ncbi:MAG: RNA polymerase sigma factor [Woeseia sp.]|nr:RNA polymerase sigma factor [Woeseia sp.]